MRLAETQVYFNKYNIIILLASKQEDFLISWMIKNVVVSIN